jgi:hypothetical protein
MYSDSRETIHLKIGSLDRQVGLSALRVSASVEPVLKNV